MKLHHNLPEADRIVTVAVDVQQDFLPGGALAVDNGDQVIAPLNDLLERTARVGGTTVATRDWHPAETPHFNTWPVHCVAETPGAAIDSALQITPDTLIINKGMGQTDGYSGYEGVADNGATIEQLVQPRGPRERVAILIGGLATDYCVLNTVLDATKQAERVRDAQQGVIDVYAVIDAMRAVNINPEDEQAALNQMREAGAHLVTTTEMIGA